MYNYSYNQLKNAYKTPTKTRTLQGFIGFLKSCANLPIFHEKTRKKYQAFVEGGLEAADEKYFGAGGGPDLWSQSMVKSVDVKGESRRFKP